MDYNTIYDSAKDLLKILYESVPFEVKQGWGMKRYNRYRVQVWKACQTTSNLERMVNGLFEYWIVRKEVSEFLEKLTTQERLGIFEMIKNELPVLIADMQREIKAERELEEEQSNEPTTLFD